MSSIKENGRYRVDAVFYRIGLLVLFPFCLFGFWFARSGYEAHSELFTCAVRKACGFPCPGCGGTRAFYYLFKGELLKSFQMNAAVLYGVAAYLHFMFRMLFRELINKDRVQKEVKLEYYLYGAAAVVVLQWLVKLGCIIHRVILT